MWIEITMATETPAGIVLINKDEQEVPDRGILFACGDKVRDEIKDLQGKVVFYNKYGGAMFKFGDKIMHALSEDDILAWSSDLQLADAKVLPEWEPNLVDGEVRE